MLSNIGEQMNLGFTCGFISISAWEADSHLQTAIQLVKPNAT